MKLHRMLRNIGMACLLGVAAAGLAGCGGSGESAQKTFTIAYAPNESTEQSADARGGMAKDLSKALGMDVKEINASDYNGIVEALRTKKADMAYLGSEGIALANKRMDGNVDVIVMKAPGGDKAKAVYHSVFITRSDRNDINSLEDVKNKKMAFVDPASTSGNLIPTGMLVKAFPADHLDAEALHVNDGFFQSALYSGKHQASIQAVAKGDVDVAAVSDQILQSEFDSGNVQKADIKIIASSDPIPSEGMIIRADMDRDLRAKLTDFLLHYDNEDYFAKVIKVKGARFAPASLADYQPIIDLNNLLSK